MKMQRYKVTLELITPAHIGCGETYEMTDFILTNEKDADLIPQPRMHIIDDALNKLVKLGHISADNIDIRTVQRTLFDKRNDLLKHVLYSRFISSELFTKYREYHENIRSMGLKEYLQDLNQWAIKRTAYDPLTGYAYIPGSSLKGAIKTAWLSHKNAKQKIKNHEIQKTLLHGGFDKDPFRNFKISDLIIPPEQGDDSIAIRHIHAVRKDSIKGDSIEKMKTVKVQGKQKQKSNVLPIGWHDVMMPSNKGGSLYIGDLILSDHKTPEFLSVANIIECCNNFYEPKLLASMKFLTKETAEYDGTTIHKYIKGKENNENICLVNIGGHSGAELKTLDSSREIHIPQAKKTVSETFMTRFVNKTSKIELTGNSVTPLGWAILRFDEIK